MTKTGATTETVPARRYDRERRARAEAEAIAEKALRDLYEYTQELEKTRRALQRSNQELEQFAYVASHDLQEPLRMVASYCQLIERRYTDALGDEGKEFVGYAVDGATRMQALINDLLTYSRVGRQDGPLRRVEAKQVVEHALVNLSNAIEESGAAISVGDLPAVMGDASQLTRLFQNLIGNAIKFRGERRPEVEVGAEPDGDNVAFRVRDNGIGIEARHVERVFQIFQRLHSREQYEGTGIGLAVCRRIVERHGGTIELESEPGVGTTFLFTLPAPRNEES